MKACEELRRHQELLEQFQAGEEQQENMASEEEMEQVKKKRIG